MKAPPIPPHWPPPPGGAPGPQPPPFPPLLADVTGGRAPTFLPWWVLLAAVPFGVVQALAGFALADGGGSTERAMGEGLGRAMWGLALAALVAWAVWRGSSRRRYVAPTVFLGVYAFLTLSALAALVPRAAQAGMARDATASVRGAQAGVKTATDQWVASGRFELKGVQTPDDLRRRVERLDALVGALRSVREAGDTAGERLRRDLADAGASTAQQDEQLTKWAAGLKLENDRQVALSFEKILEAGRGQLVLLQQEWGRWRFDASADRVVFNDPKAAARYTRQAADVAAAQSQFEQTVQRLKRQARQ